MYKRLVLNFVCLLFLCVSAYAQQVTSYATDVTRSLDMKKGQTTMGNSKTGLPELQINSSIRYQEIDGFGAAITGSTAYNLSLMPAEARHAFLEETFSPDKYAFSYVRVSIGCSDFSLSEYTLCDEPGIEHFGLTVEETKYVIPALKEILSINPALKIMGTPWTCPKWMKVKSLEEPVPFDSWTGGQLNPSCYQDYARYFVLWIQAMQQAGVPIYCITPQNEPLNRGNSASLFMGWKEQQNFVKQALGPAIREAALAVKIYAFDHNYNYDNMPDQQQYPLHIYEDAEAGRFFAGAAYHNYGGHPSELLRIHREAPDKELVFSEASIGTWNNGRDLEKSLLRDVEQLGLSTVNGWCRGSIVWNLMLDNDRGPHRGEGACATCYGVVDIDNTDYTTITRNSHFYAMAHMSVAAKPGAYRIATQPD
nr:glucosylceramidase [Bacteroidaceae bacterium]